MRGVISDLDGTLVESGLDFDQMRAEMGLPAGVPLLETIGELPAEAAERCYEILERHEVAGAARAELMPGVGQFLGELKRRGLRQGLLTRNSRVQTRLLLCRLGLTFDPVFTRDDGPIKPDPAAIWEICRAWGVEPAQVVVVGDYRYDLEAGRRAGARTVLYLGGRLHKRLPDWAALADHLLPSFLEPAGFFEWIEERL